MVMEFFRRSGESGLDHIVNEVQSMAADCEATFRLASDAVFGAVDPSAVAQEVRETDQAINRTEQEVRRLLVVHASVRGGQDSGLMLAYMNVVKDLERIGDYNKNILDLAIDGVTISDSDLQDHAEELASRLHNVRSILRDQDEQAAREFISRGDELRRGFDEAVMQLLHSEEPASSAVPRVLLHRYLKRVNAHATNVVSAVVMPLDQIDFFDEDEGDRDGSD